jgi:hypothetical protein
MRVWTRWSKMEFWPREANVGNLLVITSETR